MADTETPWPHWLDTGPLGLLALDPEGHIRATNTTLLHLLGTNTNGLAGRHYRDMPPTERRLLEETGVAIRLPATGQRPLRWLRGREEAAPGGETILLVEDVTREAELAAERDRLAAEFEHGVNADRATGLLNRAGLLMRLEPQLARCRRYGASLGVVKLTIAYPEEPSPAPAVARLIHDQLRWADMAARLEPDTFLIALPETDAGGAWEMLRRLAGRLAEELGTVPVVAHGVTEWQRGDDTAALLRRADAAMAAGGLESAAEE